MNVCELLSVKWKKALPWEQNTKGLRQPYQPLNPRSTIRYWATYAPIFTRYLPDIVVLVTWLKMCATGGVKKVLNTTPLQLGCCVTWCQQHWACSVKTIQQIEQHNVLSTSIFTALRTVLLSPHELVQSL